MLVPEPAAEVHADPLTVQVAVEVQQEGLHGDGTVAADGGPGAHAFRVGMSSSGFSILKTSVFKKWITVS